LFNQYLKLLNVHRKPPSLEALEELVLAQVSKVPFENISKLYYNKNLGLIGIPDFELFVEGLEQFRFGGTCYSTNYYFHNLLQYLGYEVILCGAGMNNPDVHLVSIAKVGGREYLIDVGYAAPFLKPIPRDLQTDFIVIFGKDRYVLKPQDANGCSRLEMYRDGVLKHGYLVNPKPKQIENFNHIIKDSFREDSTFLNALLLARFSTNYSVVIYNMTCTEYLSEKMIKHTLKNRNELIHTIEDRFNIPKKIIIRAVAELGQLKDAWI